MRARVGILIFVTVGFLAGIWTYRTLQSDKPRPEPARGEPPVEQPRVKPKAEPPPPPTQATQPAPELVFDDDPAGPLPLEGQVLDSQDLPVAGAEVMVNSNPARTVATESDGSFAFDKLLPRAYTLTARSDEQVGGPVVHKLSADSEPVAIRLRPGAAVTVTTLDERGAAVAGASITLRQRTEREVTGDDHGQARFVGVARGSAVIVARKSGYGEVRRLAVVPDGTAGESRTLEVRLVMRPGAPVAGRVIDEAGQPVADARVSARDAAELLAPGSARADHVSTGRDGRFELPALSAGSYRLRAVHEKLAPAVSAPIALDGATPRRDIEIVMPAGGVIAGKVVDAGGQPVAHAHVRVREGASDNLARGASHTRQATADEHGAFHIAALPRVQMSAMAVSDQASSDIVTVDLSATPEREDVTLSLTITGRITGRVLDAQGEPVAEAQVTALPDFFSGEDGSEFLLRGMAAATTDGGGGFAFTGLSEGAYRLRASRSGVRTASFMQQGVPARTGDTGVELTLDTPGSITGKLVFDDDGSPPEAFTVAVAFPPGKPVSEKTGEFKVGDIPAGTYDVTFRGVGFPVRRVEAVEVSPGQTTDMGTVKVARGRHVSGKVVTESGSPVAGATVTVARQLVGDGKASAIDGGDRTAAALGIMQTTTDEEGSFYLSGIGRRERLIIAESLARETAGRSLPATIPAGRDNPSYEFVLRPFGSVSGTVTMDGKPAAGANVIAAPREGGNQMLVVTTGDDGRYVYERLARGPHRLSATISQGIFGGASSSAREVDIVAGQNATADLVIELGDITVKVMVKGVEGANIDLTQLFLIKGEHAPNNAKELTDTFLRDQSGGIKQTFAVGENPITFNQVIPERYSLCAIPINGDMRDPSFQQRLQENTDQLKVYCQVEVIAESPKEQSLTATVPPMEPFTEPGSEPDSAPTGH